MFVYIGYFNVVFYVDYVFQCIGIIDFNFFCVVDWCVEDFCDIIGNLIICQWNNCGMVNSVVGVYYNIDGVSVDIDYCYF